MRSSACCSAITRQVITGKPPENCQAPPEKPRASDDADEATRRAAEDVLTGSEPKMKRLKSPWAGFSDYAPNVDGSAYCSLPYAAAFFRSLTILRTALMSEGATTFSPSASTP